MNKLKKKFSTTNTYQYKEMVSRLKIKKNNWQIFKKLPSKKVNIKTNTVFPKGCMSLMSFSELLQTKRGTTAPYSKRSNTIFSTNFWCAFMSNVLQMVLS